MAGMSDGYSSFGAKIAPCPTMGTMYLLLTTLASWLLVIPAWTAGCFSAVNHVKISTQNRL